ncbi:MAG: HlyD family secretion protein [Gemmatimonadota bacterium]
MRKRLIIIVPAVVVLAVVAVLLLRRANGTHAGLTASGTIEATEADLGFQVPGRIREVVPQEGDVVSGGEALAYLDAAELEAARDAARAQLAAAEARLRDLEAGARPEEIAAAEAALSAARRRETQAAQDLERTRNLFQGGAVSRQALDRVETALAAARASREQAEQQLKILRKGPRVQAVEAQEAVVRQARAGLERAEAALSHAIIHAPFPGVVTVRHREPGEVVPAGAPVLSILNPEDRWVRIYVRENEIGRIRIGMEAEIMADTWPDRTYRGEVIYIGSEAEFTPRNVQTAEERIKLVYPVKVRVTGDDAFELKPGIPADVTLLEDGT